MAITNNNDFTVGGIDLVSCQNPLVLDAEFPSSDPDVESGDMYVEIQGQAPCENTTQYTFDMAMVSKGGPGPFIYNFKLDITDIIRKICNSPNLQDETGGIDYKVASRLASPIEITMYAPANSPVDWINYYMHGFNQVNDPDSSCLVDFADKEGLIPIVAGAPMMFSLWYPAIGSNSGNFRLVRGASILWSNAGPTTTKTLFQIYDSSLNDAIEADWPGYPQEYELYWDSPATAKVNLVALSLACEGTVVLAWLNRYGCYSYMAFDKSNRRKTGGKHIGSFDQEIYNIADHQSRTLSRGFDKVMTTITAMAKNVPAQYFSAIEDLFYSMDIYMFTGTLTENEHDGTEWWRVEIKGELMERTKADHDNVRIEIMQPQKYTQLR